MRELESSLQQFGEFLLKAHLVKETTAPYCVRFVRQFLTRPANDGPLADRVQQFCEHLDVGGHLKARNSGRKSAAHVGPPWCRVRG